MEAFAVFDAQAEVIGQAMLAFVECLRSENILPILKEHHLEEINATQWYPLQTWLDVFKAIASDTSSAMPTLVATGMKYVETAIFPPEIDTIEDALIAVNDAYQMNHRSGYVGEFSIIIMGPGHVQVVDHTPYPDDFTYGMLYALAHRFSPEGVFPVVQHDQAAPCRKQGADSCTYDIEWQA